jgi:hypothetical protein
MYPREDLEDGLRSTSADFFIKLKGTSQEDERFPKEPSFEELAD